jgi:hypothetical protein
MKKTYATPALVLSGNSVRETKGNISGPPDVQGFGAALGSVGFYL